MKIWILCDWILGTFSFIHSKFDALNCEITRQKVF